MVDAAEGLLHVPEGAVIGERAPTSLGTHAYHHDVRLQLPQLVVAEAEALHDTRGEGLQHDVCPGDQLPGYLQCTGQLEVEADSVLVGVLVVEVAAPVGAVDAVLERTAAPKSVRIDGRFHPDDLRAVLGQVARRTRPDGVPREVNHTYAVECLLQVSTHSFSR
jgi:hypothetical protein